MWNIWSPVTLLTQRRYRRQVRSAAKARARADWPAVATALHEAVLLVPPRSGLLVQYGHALKETGRREEALAAYRTAATLAPADIDARLHLAGLLRALDREEQAGAIYADVLSIDPDQAEAHRALVDLGRRALMPVAAFGRGVLAERAAAVASLVEKTSIGIEKAATAAVIPVPFFDLFRRANPLAPPPMTSGGEADLVGCLVLAQQGSAAMLRATLTSLLREGERVSRVVVAASDELLDHPVASLVATDERLAIVAPDAAAALLPKGKALMLCASGSMIAPNGIAWLQFAAKRGNADLCYGDHDEAQEDWINGRFHSNPVLHPAHDFFAISAAAPPPVLFADASLAAAWLCEGATSGLDRVWHSLLAHARHTVHVPRLVASLYRLPPSARAAAEQFGDGGSMLEPALPAPKISVGREVFGAPTTADDRSIAVIIPTRNQAALLRRFLHTLRTLARQPRRVIPVIVDNRSDDPESHRLFAELADEGIVIVALDAPFNWSRANNLGAARVESDLLVFANNDMEMLTSHWDDSLRTTLGNDAVGAVGARLLYPNGTYQHAGVLFGIGNRTLTTHEGVGHPGDDPGPSRRWHTARQAAAVTGAFLATTRQTFSMLGGFEERLAVAYSDLDYCLRVRERGLAVVYDGTIALIHHESVSRGRNVGAAKVAWDEAEQLFFAQRWATPDLRRDPSYNPQWANDGRPYDGFREPPLEDVLARLRLGDEWRSVRLSA